MFSDCTLLYSLSDISKWDTINITNMSHIFDGCKSLSNLSDISKWDTYNVTDMSYMFKDCESLLKFPDFSKWNTDNLINISYIFFMSKSLANTSYNIQNIDKIISVLKPIKIDIIDIPLIQEIFISYWGT
jgi:surface protein